MAKTERDLLLRSWLETTFRDAVLDDKRVMEAAYLLKIGHERGDSTVETIRRCIAFFVREVIDPGASDVPSVDDWIQRN